MNREFRFSEEFGKIDERLIQEAGKEWQGKKGGKILLYRRKIACAALILAAGVALAGNEGVQAAVRKFTTKMGEVFGFTKDLSPYTELLDQAQTRNGITLTLKEVIVDDRVLMVTVHRNWDDVGNWDGIGNRDDGILERNAFPSVWINEKKTTINGQHHLWHESLSSSGINWDTLEEEPELVVVQTYEDQILPEGDVSVHLVLEAGDQVPLPGEKFDSEAEFVYDFVITSENLKAQTVKRDLDVTVKAADGFRNDLTLTELTMNDLYCRINVTGITWDDVWPNQYDLKLMGTDSFGNPVSLPNYMFLSEKELVFTTDFFGDYENTAVSDEDFRMSVPDKNCDYLELQLYERKVPWETEEEEAGAEEESGGEEGTDTYQAGGETTGEADEEILDAVGDVYFSQENLDWEPVGEPFRVPVRQGASQ